MNIFCALPFCKQRETENSRADVPHSWQSANYPKYGRYLNDSAPIDFYETLIFSC